MNEKKNHKTKNAEEGYKFISKVSIKWEKRHTQMITSTKIKSYKI